MPLFQSAFISNSPIYFEYFHDQAKILSGSVIQSPLSSSYKYGFIAFQEPPAIDNSWVFYRSLQPGNYRLYFLCNVGNQFGKLKLEVDNSLAFDNLDFYQNGVSLHQTLTKDIAITEDGLHEFKFTIFEKNPLATDYYCSITKIWALQI
ncbi:hypothetical protein [Nostoc sp. GT001]|uniref:hypothetical protein n=1 Tax=Nostoc sp. GT001 TaxID=3056647 RepID=UPI0025AAF058|nr:hypothetical protein [Nostoc sp. GT001]MDM9582321.1 hypothetical protein [Nostoc sp. GT001]